jgi:ribosomal protein S18 acetylase RimI-like enzyme
MEPQTKAHKINTLKSFPRDFLVCFEIFEQNMKQIIEENETWEPEKFEDNFKTREIRTIQDKKTKQIIGFFQVQYRKDLTYIKNIQIQKEFQEKGIEIRILKTIQNEANEKKLPKLQLKILQNNSQIELYENFGFRITEKLDFSYTMEL